MFKNKEVKDKIGNTEDGLAKEKDEEVIDGNGKFMAFFTLLGPRQYFIYSFSYD